MIRDDQSKHMKTILNTIKSLNILVQCTLHWSSVDILLKIVINLNNDIKLTIYRKFHLKICMIRICVMGKGIELSPRKKKQ